MTLPTRAVISKRADFWLMGGASIVAWALVILADQLRDQVTSIDTRFVQIPILFSMLTLVCNYPHFFAAYRLAYGRGSKFIFKNWFALLAVPVILLSGYVLAFTYFEVDISDSPVVASVNDFLRVISLNFRFGAGSKLGAEIMGLSVWLMYITVGWHYSKQVFGTVLMQARFAHYPISKNQRLLLKLSVFSVAIFQFVYLLSYMNRVYGGTRVQDPRYGGIYISQLIFAPWVENFVLAATGVFFLAVLIFIFAKNKKSTRANPPLNMVTPWVAFYVWWIPVMQLPEFYLMMVPFFHALQYLPFAHRLETSKKRKYRYTYAGLFIAIVVIGFLFFELVPGFLDRHFDTNAYQSTGFFLISFALFINIHHFFIDSVTWRFTDHEVRDAF